MGLTETEAPCESLNACACSKSFLSRWMAVSILGGSATWALSRFDSET